MTTRQHIGIAILRLALAFVFLWFGFSQLSNASLWTSFVPVWATNFMSAGTLVIVNGFFEVIAGSLLAFGLFSRYVALLLGLHLFVIGLSMGISSAIGIRDMGLALATISIFFLDIDIFTISFYITKKKTNKDIN